MKINLKDFLEAGILGKLRLILNDQEAKKIYLSMIAPQLALVVIVATMGWKSLIVLSVTLIVSFYLPVLVMNTILNNLMKTAFMTNPQKQQAAFQKESSTSSVMKKASQLFETNRHGTQQQSETQQATKKQVEVEQPQQQSKTSDEIKDIVNQVELLRKELYSKDNLEEKVKKLEEQTYVQRRPTQEERPRRMTLEERKERRAKRVARRGEIQVDQQQ